MNIPKYQLELPPEAEPARDFIEALAARYESQITISIAFRAGSISHRAASKTESSQLLSPLPRGGLEPGQSHIGPDWSSYRERASQNNPTMGG
jgi:hypothetical protein